MMFYGGEDPKNRAAPNSPPYARIHGLGPAFFTKFLYFTSSTSLILDNVLARKVHELSGLPYLVRSGGQSYVWTPLPVRGVLALDVSDRRHPELRA